jgi:hypothetical protein
MAGFSPALPIRRSSQDGIALTKNMLEVIKQNLKNLVLTNPGERVMLPLFGVGIKRVLFEMNNAKTQAALIGAIESQVAKYMPFLSIDNVDFQSRSELIDPNGINVRIIYHVTPLQYNDVLHVQI